MEWSGRIALHSLAADAASVMRESFLSAHSKPFLLQIEGDASSATPTPSRFQTLVVPSPVRDQRPTPMGTQWAYELRKRPGSNAFAMMVTLGRAPNNDIVVAADAVSKFHASFMETPSGWTITDASTNGTWLDGERLQPKKGYPLRPGSCVAFAQSVKTIVLTPEQVYGEIERVRRGLVGSGS